MIWQHVCFSPVTSEVSTDFPLRLSCILCLHSHKTQHMGRFREHGWLKGEQNIPVVKMLCTESSFLYLIIYLFALVGQKVVFNKPPRKFEKSELHWTMLLWCLCKSQTCESWRSCSSIRDQRGFFLCVCALGGESFYKRDCITTFVHGCYWVLAAFLQVQGLDLNGRMA